MPESRVGDGGQNTYSASHTSPNHGFKCNIWQTMSEPFRPEMVVGREVERRELDLLWKLTSINPNYFCKAMISLSIREIRSGLEVGACLAACRANSSCLIAS